MENNEEEGMMMLEKIPLGEFIDILVDLFDKGADYIDLVGTPNIKQDGIQIIVRKEYIAEEERSEGSSPPITDEDQLNDYL